MGFLLLLPWLAGCSQFFDDPIEEFDPLSLSETDLNTQISSSPVQRKHILESFGNYNCSSCPAAEEFLAQYLQEGESLYNPNLAVINYHTDFSGPQKDKWRTDNTQAFFDLNFTFSLPQVMLNGNNEVYGFNAENISFIRGEYPSLLKLVSAPESTFLEVTMDTASISYNTTTGSASFSFSVINHNKDSATGPLTFRIAAVKNEPVFLGWTATPWETIVVEIISGSELATPDIAPLSGKVFSVFFPVGDPLQKHVSGQENDKTRLEPLEELALIVMVSDSNRIILNSGAFQYHPVKSNP